jgi:choline dehydrogenase-like flavoprotein
VVLTAGALRTPQLLMLSGVGPAAHLTAHGIPVLADLPGVGSNLHDHPMITPVWPITSGTTLLDAGSDAASTAYRLARRGPQASVAQALAMQPLPTPSAPAAWARPPVPSSAPAWPSTPWTTSTSPTRPSRSR